MKVWKDYQEQHKDRFLSELLELLRIPSVSARSEHKEDMNRCAEAVKQRLLEAGADSVTIYPTAGHPVVYGEKIIDASKPTILVYGHYDVQPADPLELWKSGPFEPVIKDGKIYARGSCDDKGQFYMHVKALETMTQTNTLQANVKFIIEGEEEIGSPNLATFVKANKDLLTIPNKMSGNAVHTYTIQAKSGQLLSTAITGNGLSLTVLNPQGLALPDAANVAIADIPIPSDGAYVIQLRGIAGNAEVPYQLKLGLKDRAIAQPTTTPLTSPLVPPTLPTGTPSPNVQTPPPVATPTPTQAPPQIEIKVRNR